MKKILFIVGTHGNEGYAISVVKKLQKELGSFDYIIGNPKAVKINKRFVSSDLNRIYPGKKDGDYEERRAYKIFEKMQSYDCVIDVHGVPGEDHKPFIILSNKTNKLGSYSLAKLFPIEKTVIWSSLVHSQLGSTMKHFPNQGFAIEYGLKNVQTAQKDLEEALRIFLKNIQKETPDEYPKQFFKAVGYVQAEEMKDINPDTIEDFKVINMHQKVYVPILPRAYIRMGGSVLFVNVVELSAAEALELLR